ncbi:protein TolR [Vreelandella subglaciescola]|jgi:biopolymer transport protein TolR|uniref:Tol-Pal system protein TolR n=1 Tax=Vreelandella subglaciescola TaxID=29571 RepID=A0A1M7EMU1_9GAMM|nr:protein TolR [Halomonas subglaciescola]SHL92978.1 Cell division and transport-associated protein TolR [Halomonas subglaciescola]
MQGPFNRSGQRRPMAEINVVPFIDVMLVLLVIFMITAPMLNQGVDVDLPQATAEPIDTPDNTEPVIVSVDQDGSYYITLGEDTAAVESDELTKRVSAIIQRSPETPVMVRGDRNVAYGQVVTLMSTLQRSGVANVGLISEPGHDE